MASAWAGNEGCELPACPESVAAAATASTPAKAARTAGRPAARMESYFFFFRVSRRALAAPRFGALAGARLTYFSK